MAGLGAPELIIILMVVVLLFGAARLPKLARAIGEASREFKHGVTEGEKPEETPVEENTQSEAGGERLGR